MTAQKIIAAALLAATGSAFAADAPANAGAANAAVSAATTAATTATVASASATNLNLPALNSASVRDRAAVRAEAVEAAKNRKTTLAAQLDQYK